MAVKKNTTARGSRAWVWRRWTAAGQQEIWIERLRTAGCASSWALTERPGHTRILLETYPKSRIAAMALARQWGGRLRAVNAREWMKTKPTPPTRIGREFEIIHESASSRRKHAGPTLHIPHGVAFGSGEHATTCMLLSALVRRRDWSGFSVLDLGTGSGVLALTARLFGAKRIVATDFDPDAIRTAAQNEALNFNQPLIRWRCADVRRLRAKARYDLVLANLFSGILAEASSQIADCVAPGGELWLSGILHLQVREVAAAYRLHGMQVMRTFRRGKWTMLALGANVKPPVPGVK